jgi:hypothetical protein
MTFITLLLHPVSWTKILPLALRRLYSVGLKLLVEYVCMKPDGDLFVLASDSEWGPSVLLARIGSFS